MKNFAMALIVLGVSSGTAEATDQERCTVLSGPISNASASLAKMYKSMSGLDYQGMSTQFSGAEREQMLKMADLQEKLLPVFDTYVFELENLALMINRCSR